VADLGCAIGSHTMTHPALPALGSTAAATEIARSRNVLSDMLGRAIEWFAYPYGLADASTRALVRGAGYRGAVGSANQPHERYYMNRIDASVVSVPQLRLRCNGLVHVTRHTYRQVRYGL
jgi:peptidoglycan/xylan/chitin deacetylase (PgdA/CDA1 family)